jgi:hypothetical protein
LTLLLYVSIFQLWEENRTCSNTKQAYEKRQNQHQANVGSKNARLSSKINGWSIVWLVSTWIQGCPVSKYYVCMLINQTVRMLFISSRDTFQTKSLVRQWNSAATTSHDNFAWLNLRQSQKQDRLLACHNNQFSHCCI